MTTQPIISARHLAKRFELGRQERYQTLRDSIVNFARAPVASLRRERAPELWALEDVSFDIPAGEAVGVIGRNGAGKSTLLKILTRITEPTRGEAVIRGRVGSLLEVGTGFHPELTGRENIRLNGAILGMSRHEVSRKFDDIVAFAEVDRFIDTPVKRYSSGMYVRLAFAVAAHLETEVLLVDEVLAVGDIEFQKKCLGKMGELANTGRTVLFVSHNMAAVKALTSRCLWLERGRLREAGPSQDIVNSYLAASGGIAGDGEFDEGHIEARRVRHANYPGDLKLRAVTLRNGRGKVSAMFVEDEEMRADLLLEAAGRFDSLDIRVRVKTLEGQLVFETHPVRSQVQLAPGRHLAQVHVPLTPLLAGVYQADVVLASRVPQDKVIPAFQFEIVPRTGRDDDARYLQFSASAGADSAHAQLGVIRVESTLKEIHRIE